MTLEDLKIGYIVKTKNNKIFYVNLYCSTWFGYTNELILSNTNNEWIPINSIYFNEDMTCRTDSEYDIVEVYGYSTKPEMSLLLDINKRPLKWKRPKTKEMTIDEIEKRLGYKIKIVKKKRGQRND